MPPQKSDRHFRQLCLTRQTRPSSEPNAVRCLPDVRQLARTFLGSPEQQNRVAGVCRHSDVKAMTCPRPISPTNVVPNRHRKPYRDHRCSITAGMPLVCFHTAATPGKLRVPPGFVNFSPPNFAKTVRGRRASVGDPHFLAIKYRGFPSGKDRLGRDQAHPEPRQRFRLT